MTMFGMPATDLATRVTVGWDTQRATFFADVEFEVAATLRIPSAGHTVPIWSVALLQALLQPYGTIPLAVRFALQQERDCNSPDLSMQWLLGVEFVRQNKLKAA